MAHPPVETVDPRIRRTRALLSEALGTLLEQRPFGEISIQDIADRATVNRATFYDHYPDKEALLECMVAQRFFQLLERRKVSFDAGCASSLGGIVLGVCDYLTEVGGSSEGAGRRLEPHLEAAVIGVVRRMILDGAKKHSPAGTASPEMVATTVSWGLYGAAKEWYLTPNRCPSEEVVGTIVELISRAFRPAPALASG